MNDKLLQKAQVRFDEVYALASTLYPMPKKCELSFNIKGRVAGRAIRSDGEYFVRLNPEAVAHPSGHVFKNTIPHEIAHIVVFFNQNNPSFEDRGHGVNWKRIASSLGWSGKRTHDMKLTPARKLRQFEYISDQGVKCVLTIIRHNRVQHKGITYKLKKGGSINNGCKYRELV